MMSMNSKQPHFAMHPTLPEHKYPSLHSSSEAIRRACLPTPPVSALRPRPGRAPPPEQPHAGLPPVQAGLVRARRPRSGRPLFVSSAGGREGSSGARLWTSLYFLC